MCACNDSDTDAPLGSQPSAGTGAAAADGGGANSFLPGGGQDRCLGATTTCGRGQLPPQPDVPFLSDAGDGWLRLIEADWELAPGTEGYRCVGRTLSQDVYVVGFSPLLPPGTHHTVVVVDQGGATPDGVRVCGVTAGGERRLQGAGAGTQMTSMLPAGVAMKIAAGEQLNMNLHLFNPTNDVLRGTSGMRVKVVTKAQVQVEAEVRLIGPLGLQIPRGEVVQRGSCTFAKPATVFSVGPHLHQLGVHAKVVAYRAVAGDKVLHDAPYDFDHQYVYPIEEVQLAAGDRIGVECTYLNDTDALVTWGDSSLSEMCFAAVGVYPSTNQGGFPCSN
jgi:hypothetical protein